MELDLGHQILLVVIGLILVRDLVASFLNSKERADMTNKLMARTLTEYTQSTLALSKEQRGDLTEEEEDAIFDEKMKADRISV